MPYSKNPASNPTSGRKPASGGSKGAQREGHRGYRADQGAASAAPKKRWTADDRAARTGDRPVGSARPDRENRRPDWSPREKPATQRGAYGDRPARPAYGDRTERPVYGDRTARPSYGDRPART